MVVVVVESRVASPRTVKAPPLFQRQKGCGQTVIQTTARRGAPTQKRVCVFASGERAGAGSSERVSVPSTCQRM